TASSRPRAGGSSSTREVLPPRSPPGSGRQSRSISRILFMFADVVGQDRAVELLRRASARPSHAYLLVGPRGSGVEDAAREFAALLISVGDDARGLHLVQRGVHPDVVEFAPGGPSYRVKEDVRE